jgi:hypothetical protein
LLVIALGALFSGCVSVNIGGKKLEKSSDISFKAPTAPFTEFEAQGADSAWRNRKNGNSISFLSTCNDPTDPPLSTLQTEMLSTLDNVRVIRSETTSYNAREALSTEAEGMVEGIKTRLELLIFKKNQCIYTLSFVGVATRFGEDQDKFHEFLKTFEAP